MKTLNTILLGLFFITGVTLAQQKLQNLAPTAAATQSSTFSPAKNAIDGVTNTFSLTGLDPNAWLELEFKDTNWIEHLEVWPRASSAPTNFWIFVSNRPFTSSTTNVAFDPDVTTFHYRFLQWVNYPQILQVRRLGRYVRVQLDFTGNLELGEVGVIGFPFTGTILNMIQRQFVFTENGHSVTDRQDGLIVIGVPGLAYDIENRANLTSNWSKVASTTATNYEHKWYGPRSRTTNGATSFFRSTEKTNAIIAPR